MTVAPHVSETDNSVPRPRLAQLIETAGAALSAAWSGQPADLKRSPGSVRTAPTTPWRRTVPSCSISPMGHSAPHDMSWLSRG